MPEQGRISVLQVVVTLSLLYVGVVILVPSVVLTAGRDSWIAELSVGVLQQLILVVHFALIARFPGKTLVQIVREALGPLLGTVVAAFHTMVFFFYCIGTFRSVGDFLLSTLIPDTPIEAVIIPLGLVAAYAARSGIESLGRTATALFPIFALGIAFLHLSLKDSSFEHLLPVLDRGWGPVIEAAAITTPVFAEATFLPSLFAMMVNRNGAPRILRYSLALAGILNVAMHLTTIAVLGDSLAISSNFPVFAIARQISISDFLERMEAVFMTVIMMGYFIRIAFFLYATAFTTAEVWRFRDYRPLVLPFLGLMIPLAMLQWDSQRDYRESFIQVYGQPLFWLGSVILPLATLLIAAIRFRRRNTAPTKTDPA